jgi:hypothetical protein
LRTMVSSIEDDVFRLMTLGTSRTTWICICKHPGTIVVTSTGLCAIVEMHLISLGVRHSSMDSTGAHCTNYTVLMPMVVLPRERLSSCPEQTVVWAENGWSSCHLLFAILLLPNSGPNFTTHELIWNWRGSCTQVLIAFAPPIHNKQPLFCTIPLRYLLYVGYC